MQRLLPLLFLNLLCCLLAAQPVVNPLQLNDAEWRVSKVTGGPGMPSNDYLYFYKLCGDSTINGRVYKRVFAASHNVNTGPPTSLSYHPDGFFRQDPVTKRSYYRLPPQGDSLIMDYNLQVGDTIKGGYYSQGLYSQNIILKIDSIQLPTGGPKHKAFYTDTTIGAFNPPGIWFLEGVGNVCGFLEPVVIPLSGYATFLEAFDQNYSCADVLGIAPGNETQPTVKVFCDPAGNTLTVSSVKDIARIEIWDATGKLMETLPGTVSAEQTFVLKTQGDGLFIYRVYFTDRSAASGRFVKCK
jgi:hypothetical protein